MLASDPVTGIPINDTTGILSGDSAMISGGSNGGDSIFSGIGGFFTPSGITSIGGAIATDYHAIAGPTTVRPGTIIYNPNGTTSVAGSVLGSGNSSVLLLLGIGLLILFLILRSR
jgi:hypothetical protein